MDFWSRLLAHTHLSSGSYRKDFAKDPTRRLHRFEQEYSQLLQTWRTSSNLVHDDEAAENIEIRLQELTNILSDESRRPLPHPCITFCATKQVYIPVAKIATSSSNEWVVKEAVLFFATLIESEEEAFVENDNFSASLTNLLVRITGANSRLGSDTEARVLELAFNITTKIRLEPEILPAWFKSNNVLASSTGEKPLGDREKFTGKTQKQDFPLFYLLMDYIHSDGKVGDFARTGLLYIIEAASNSVDLEQWIVESDLSTLMATGLGALYSQLSRKLVIDHPAQDLPPILAFSDYQHPKSDFEVVSSCSPQYQSHLETFLSHLQFWQDVLNHCRSVDVKSTLLEHFQVIFLQQLLYPSLLESSDVDGGSSVAVLTYLRRILESLDHPDMVNLILHYLLALPDAVPSMPVEKQSSVSAARKRKSMDLASIMASHSESAADPLLFSLVDLILACLRSQSEQTIQVTLQLVSVILKRHHRYAVLTLVYTEGVHNESAHRTSGAHVQEVDYLMSLAGAIGGQDDFDEVYQNVLHDTMSRLESHPCSLRLVAPKTSVNNHKLPAIPDSLPGAPRDIRPHTIRPDDPLLNIVLDRLETFFLNSAETNLALTEAIFDLAVCGFVFVEGWLLRSPFDYVYDDDESEEASKPSTMTGSELAGGSDEAVKAQSMRLCRRRPSWQASRLPRLLRILQGLLDEIRQYREIVPKFDYLLQRRREAFQTADSTAPAPTTPQTNNASTPTPVCSNGNAASSSPSSRRERTNSDDVRNASPGRPSGLAFAQRIFSEFGTPSRSGSPRAAKGDNRSSSSDRSAQPAPMPSRELSSDHGTPPRGSIRSALGIRSFSPGSPSGPSIAGSHESKGDVVESQRKAFEAVDQSILARRVGIPAVQSVGEKTKVDARSLAFELEEHGDRSDGTAQSEETEELDDEGRADTSSGPSYDNEKPGGTTPAEKTASVSHILTNVLILQSFIFELASIVQVRAGLFDEVRFA